MAEFVVDYLLDEDEVMLALCLFSFLLLASVALLYDLLHRNQTGSVFYRSQPEYPSLLNGFVRIVSVVDQQVSQDSHGVSLCRQATSEVQVQQCGIVVLLSVDRLDWGKFGEIALRELMEFDLYSPEKCLSAFPYPFQGVLAERAMESGDVDVLSGHVDVVSRARGKQSEPLPFFLVLPEIISRFRSLDRIEVIQDGLQ